VYIGSYVAIEFFQIEIVEVDSAGRW